MARARACVCVSVFFALTDRVSTILLSCVCVWIFFPFMFVGRTSRGHTGRSHRISHPPFFCGACLNFSREKDSAIPFPRRLWSRILCTNDLIVLHPLGIFILFFSFLVRKTPFAGIELASQRVRGLRGTSELPGRPACLKKNQNAPRHTQLLLLIHTFSVFFLQLRIHTWLPIR